MPIDKLLVVDGKEKDLNGENRQFGKYIFSRVFFFKIHNFLYRHATEILKHATRPEKPKRECGANAVCVSPFL